MDRKHELALIAAVQQGDTQAFTALYNENVDRVYRYIYYRVHRETAAEDLTADVFVQVLEGLATYQDRSMPLLAWIYRIAHARVIDYYRKARFRDNQANVAELEIGVEYDMDDQLMETYKAEQVHAAIHRLNEEQKDVILLRFIEGCNLEMTATLLGKSVAAVKSLQYRAVQTLTQILAKEGFKSDEYTS